MTQSSLQNLIKEITAINEIIKKQNSKHEINIDSIIETIVNKEKEYNILKYNLNKCNDNLQENLKLLKQKCDIEYKISEILIQHKIKLEELQKKHKIELPTIDKSIQNLFSLDFEKHNLDKSNKNEHKKVIYKEQKEKPQGKINANILQEQLSAAIESRRSSINPQ